MGNLTINNIGNDVDFLSPCTKIQSRLVQSSGYSFKILSPCELSLDGDLGFCSKFNSREDNIYTLSLSLSKPIESQAFSIEIMLKGWGNISYLAFGNVVDGKYKHIKVKHPLQNTFESQHFSYKNLDYFITMQESFNYKNIECIKIFIKAENITNEGRFYIKSLSFFSHKKDLNFKPIKSNLSEIISIIIDYQKRVMPDYQRNAKFYLQGLGLGLGKYGLIENKNFTSHEELIAHNNSLRYSFHAQSQVAALLLYYYETQDPNAIISARELCSVWLSKHFFSKSSDMQYAWYDHGVAERQITFILLAHMCTISKYDQNFLNTLNYVIKAQGQLLASESFYARNQNYRYHNHGLFQDIALLCTASFIQNDKWILTAIKRAKDQFNQLIINWSICIFSG